MYAGHAYSTCDNPGERVFVRVGVYIHTFDMLDFEKCRFHFRFGFFHMRGYN